jgi:FkbM family methyltransferase
VSVAKSIARKLASRLPERKITKSLTHFKMELLSSHTIDFKILYGAGHEPKTVAAINRLVKPGMNAIDVGANIGWMTLHLAAAVGPGGRVIAFEPSDWTFWRLEHNIRLNDFSWARAMHAAVGSSDRDSVELTVPCGYRLDGADTATKQTMPMVRLDTAAAGLSRVDFVKSDTDGYEPGVFEGARAILRRDRPILLFEVAPYHSGGGDRAFRGLFDELGKLGYGFESLSGAPREPLQEMARLSRHESTDLIARPL